MTAINPHRSHIDDIIGLIDKVLGPDDGGPTPDRVAYEPGPARPLRPARRTPGPRRRLTTRQLENLTPADLATFLGGRERRRLTHNTFVARHPNGGDGIRIIFHATTILFIHPADGKATYVLNSGGYHTTTTKQRLNALLPAGYRVFARNFEWFLSTPDGAVEFEDGLTIEA